MSNNLKYSFNCPSRENDATSIAKAQFDKVLIVFYVLSSKLVNPKIQNLTAFSGTLGNIKTNITVKKWTDHPKSKY